MDFTPEIELISQQVNFSPLNNKSILVTGATGFIGRWVGVALQAASKQGARYAFCGLGHEALDLIRADGLYSHYDYILHLAPVMDKTYVKMFEAMTPLSFLYTSSGAVYHDTPNAYGRMKIEHEDLVRSSKLPYKIARLFTFSGAYLDPNKAIYQLLHDAFSGNEINIYGDGHTIRSYMYAADLVIALFDLLLNHHENSIDNIGSPKKISILKLAERIRDQYNQDAKIVIHNQIVEQSKIYYCDTLYDEIYSLNAGLDRMAEWMKNEVIK